MERDDFDKRRGIDEIKDDSPRASVIGIGLPALVIVAAAAAYFFWPASDASVNQAETTPPATTQPAPKANPDPVQTTPQSEQKEPPAAEPKPNEMRDPRTDSQNAN